MLPDEATQVIGYLLAAFRPRDWSDASSAVYVEAIGDLDAESAMKTVRWLVEHERFMPTVAELLTEYRDHEVYQSPFLALPSGECAAIAAGKMPVPDWIHDQIHGLVDKPRLNEAVAMTRDEVAREGQMKPPDPPKHVYRGGVPQGSYDAEAHAAWLVGLPKAQREMVE